MKHLIFRSTRSKKLKKLALLLLLIATCLPAWAADYVFIGISAGTTYYMTVSNTGTLTRTANFDPATCIWVLDNNNLSITINSTKYTFGYDRSGLGTLLSPYSYNWGLNQDYDASITISGTTASCTVNTNYTGSNTTAYIRYNSNNFEFATTNSNLAQAYLLTTTDYPALSHIEGIEGNDAIGLTGTYDYTKIGSAVALPPDCVQYTFNRETYYKLSDNSITTTAPLSSEFDYTWSVTCNDATYTGFSINSNTGALSITSLPTTDKTLTITLQATKTGQETQTVTKTVNVSNRPPTGVVGGTVYLNDYEDHTWTYYAGVPTTVDGGNYNTNYAGKMYSPDPRNVKITYKANGGAVSIDEDEDEFVYYKTIEKVGDTYKYQVISNPFSKRPTGKGFGGWEVVSGGDYIGKSTGDVLNLDEELTLIAANLKNVAGGDYVPNCTSAEIVLKATWVDATVVRNTTSGLSSSGTYETNIIVLSQNYSTAISPSYPCTIMMVEPDGSEDYRTDYTFSRGVTPPTGGIVKLEFAKWSPNGDIAMGGRNLWIGRGVTCTGDTRSVTLAANNGTINQVAKIESGSFTTLTHYSSKPTGITKQILVLGNDYDRANSDNTKLTFSGRFEVNRCDGGSNYAQEACRVYSKSGSFMTGISIESANQGNSYYLSYYSWTNPQRSRYFEIEGGDWYANIAGGQDYGLTANNYVAFKFRMRGGRVRGSIYGAAEQTNISGNRVLVFTGGQIGGWIAGGANGTASGSGTLTGSTYVYVGGTADVNSQYQMRDNSTTTAIRVATGGYVFGSGVGYDASSHAGEVTVSTNVVFGDNASVEHGVYGGGTYGYSSGTANVYITGAGHVESLYDSQANAFGGVYGGARQNDGKDVNIYMTGGQIDGVTYSSNHGGGLFGGSNASGTLSGNVNMVVTGGQIGTSTNNANIHGGGYGASTTVSGNVELTLGTEEQTVNGAKICGNVYGGSALGTTGGTGKHTYVTVNRGSVTGNVFGGGMGEHSSTTEGVVTGAINVTINGTDPASNSEQYALAGVYGGGDYAPYAGTPVVSVHNCDNSIEYVYGGGNATSVSGTDVTIWGGNKIGTVFGGGNGLQYAANVTGNTSVKIYGGTIGDIYGGSNTNGTIGGTITVNVNSQAESTSGTACPMAINNVYGGGNKAASNAGTVNIGCTGPYVAATEGVTESGYIRNVYGGANQANITGNIGLTIKAGHIDNVFGGNNNSGSISGNITVTVKEDKTTYNCGESNDMLIGNVYGGGNLAAYGSTGSNYPVVKILNGTITGNVFGGGKGDSSDETHAKGAVTGAPQVTIGDAESAHTVTIKGDVYGGGDAAKVDGVPVVVVSDCNTTIGVTEGTPAVKSSGTVYGGGNAAPVNGTNVTVNGGQIYDVFGGGHGNPSENVGADVNGNVTVSIKGGTIERVFAGSNALGNITGTSSLSINKDGSCDMKINEVYGGGNLAAGNAGTITIGCTGTGDDEGIGDVYGGANMADIGTSDNPSNITLNVTGGTINRVFGGNNTSGKIYGSITVNVNEGTSCDLDLNYVYGAGNKAAYAPKTAGAYPAVNIKNGTVTYDVFGGGLGSTATVTSNPTVLIDGGTVSGNVFGGGSEANTVGNPSVTIKTGTVTKDVYGGGALANVTGNTTVSLTGGTVTGNTYGGGLGRLADAENGIAAVAAMVTGNTTVTVNGGKSNNVFGCNNLNGGPTGNVTVTVTTGTITNNVYGGGNLAAASVSPVVTINGGKMDKVYGGGLGSTAVITGSPVVTINKTATSMTVVDVFGGGDAAGVTGNTTVNLTAGSVTRAFGGGNLAAITGTTAVNLTGATAANVYGGGNEAGVSSTATVAMSAGSVTGGLYGGCNTKGKVSGDITVGVTGGTVGTDASHKANVHGGGYGYQTQTGEDVAVTINGASAVIYGDVYGGSALGSVNDASTETTTVTLTSGTIYGDLYGGGLGDATNAAGVAGKTVVAIKGGTVNNVFGCNNANGAPTTGASVTVNGGTINNNVYGGGNLAAASVSPVVTINNGTLPGSVFGGGKGAPSDASHETAMVTGNPQVVIGDDVSTHSVSIAGNVFGGGDAANVKGATTVTVNKCNTLIGAKNTSDEWSTTAGTVYGGGNAADVVKNGTTGGSTSVVVNGGDIYRVFGGGNGEGASNPGANVANGTNVAIHAGNIHQAFAGSNAKGNITGTSIVTIDHDITACNELIDEVYGGGNLAAGNAGAVTVECGAIIGDLYGGANQANIGTSTSPSNITLNVTGGTINRVFGGNNTSGNVTGKITVNINKADDCSTFSVGTVYGAGNQASYTPTTAGAYPEVNILKGKVTNDVFGGGLGASATVTSSPVVNINGGNVGGSVYGGGSLASVSGSTTVNLKNANSTVTGNIYGGGLGCNDCGTSGAAVAANISGSTSVNISLGTVANVFGCNNIYGAPATGATVTVTGGTITDNVYGGGNLAAASVGPVVNINNGTLPGSVFGGGLGSTAIITGSPKVTIGSSTSTDEVKIAGNVFGGGDAANVVGSPQVTVNKCNTMIGTKTSGEWNTTGGTVYGGGNAAHVTGTYVSTNVIINGGDIRRVFGGGNGEVSAANVAGNANTTIHAGNIHQAFAGSNTTGNITGTANITIDHDISTCNEKVDELYGGGNVAAGNAGSVTIECGAEIGTAFGGANNADVNSDITLNITGGSIDNIFGGNNNGGIISGKITVNVDWEDGCTSNYIGNVYGGGNVAAYTAPSETPNFPQVNIRNAEVEYDVFGGGLGAAAVVTGNPQVNINTSDCTNTEHSDHSVTVKGSVYGGGSAAAVVGNPHVLIKGAEGDDNKVTVKTNVFGGGLGAGAAIRKTNASATNGNTTIRIEGNSTIEGNVYGGGNAGAVEGNTDVQIGSDE